MQPKSRGLLSAFQFKPLTSFFSLFDRYWLAVAFSRSQCFPDEIERWPVEMLLAVNAREIKQLYARLAKEIMDGLKPR